MIVGAKAANGVYLSARLNQRPCRCFARPDPFAVVRPGEVLTIFFISMEENGRGGRGRFLRDHQYYGRSIQTIPSPSQHTGASHR